MLDFNRQAMLKILANTIAEEARGTGEDRMRKYGGARYIGAYYIVKARRLNELAKKLHGNEAFQIMDRKNELEAVTIANKILLNEGLFVFAPDAYTLYVGDCLPYG